MRKLKPKKLDRKSKLAFLKAYFVASPDDRLDALYYMWHTFKIGSWVPDPCGVIFLTGFKRTAERLDATRRQIQIAYFYLAELPVEEQDVLVACCCSSTPDENGRYAFYAECCELVYEYVDVGRHADDQIDSTRALRGEIRTKRLLGHPERE